MLATTLHGDPVPQTDPLLIVHGLFGSARNWGVIAKNLSAQRQIITVDLRNHGASFWADSNSYPDLADDLAQVIDAHGGRADVLGHSMGGKAAMVLALTRPDLVPRLIVADIAPVQYAHTQMRYIEAMQSLDLSTVSTRMDADRQLRAEVPELAIRAFLLQSLDLTDKRWRLNLEVLAAEMPEIMGFPNISAQFDHPTMFLSGGKSDYVLPDHRATITALFPHARFVKIPGANHWLHAEKPREFEAAVETFLR
ncbi:alpha/beta fold hydrolase [Pseudoruegeria sp. SK021]|uniref:alpha/beta fold hydrolase n=1 Tax=Pseudoruegeria sp. SK021 TaxID=1933035 RepID=UPI000A219BF7|nr:alpha/beta fold hydrolase [Pseudoruegeria sp. SK021]OSP53873.1 alpha/beta hydrolase [Pseudoruegeria sp. SK021]